MTTTLYWISGSPFAWRAMLVLEHKGIKYESQRLDASKEEQKTAEFLAINPRGKVPALRDKDTTIYESLAIMEYLERIKPEPNLFGSSASESAAVKQCICELDNYTLRALMGIVQPVLFTDGTQALPDMKDAIVESHREFQFMEDRLASSDYLASDRLTAADFAFVPALEYVLRAADKQQISEDGFGFSPLGERYPNIAAWQGRMSTIPALAKAYPPHWRD
ncbi:MAG: glutathione S-transferase family protein [Gammaproteobacteria bacterium]|nr:glutathione S-transferase family protein [Gammaproteobacteria bacterium]